jgi:hypothetical protein
MPEEILPEEADSTTVTTVEGDAIAHPEEQKPGGAEMFKSSAITVVLQLMPLTGGQVGRTGLLSIRNDDDAPLFAAPLGEEELFALVATPCLARLIEELTNLLPERLEEREARRAKEQARPVPPKTPVSSTPPSTKKGKGSQKTTQARPSSSIDQPYISSSQTTGASTSNSPAVPQSVFVPNPAPEIDQPPGKDKPQQLTFF